MYVASEITRQVPGWWDSFSASFEAGELIDTKQSEYAVVVTIERLKTSKRSWGSEIPPTTIFSPRIFRNLTRRRLQPHFPNTCRSATLAGRCVFDTEGYEREKHKSVC